MNNGWYSSDEKFPELEVPVLAICKNFSPLAPKGEYWSLTAIRYQSI